MMKLLDQKERIVKRRMCYLPFFYIKYFITNLYQLDHQSPLLVWSILLIEINNTNDRWWTDGTDYAQARVIRSLIDQYYYKTWLLATDLPTSFEKKLYDL